MKYLFTICLLVLIDSQISAQQFHLVKDINPSGSGSPEDITTFNDALYFRANNGTEGNELWKSEGLETSTKLLKDINPAGNSFPDEFTEYNGRLYFSAEDEAKGREVWSTDGTTSGTRILKDINTKGSSTPKQFTVLGNNLFFVADDGKLGTELWITDGTVNGTHLLKDINSNGNSVLSNFTIFNNKLYFNANKQLWETDGTTAGTILIKNVDFNLSIEYKNNIYFQGKEDNRGYELWKTDGTPSGTNIVKDINPNGSSDPREFIIFKNKLFFQANDGIRGNEIWSSDGTESGTTLFWDFDEELGSNPTGFYAYNDKLYFQITADSRIGETPVDFNAAYTYGTEGTIFPLFDYNQVFSGGTTTFFSYHKRLFCITKNVMPLEVNTFNFYELTQHSTGYRIPENANGEALASTTKVVEYNGSLYFRAEYGSEESELWKYTADIASISQKYSTIQFKIFPNPSSHFLSISSQKEVETISILNTDGRLISTFNNMNKIDISGLESGVYMLHIKTAEGSGNRLFVKK